MARTEVLLVLGLFGFYLYDALLLLYADEVVFVRGRRGWRASPGIGFLLGGRYPCLPAPFAPMAPVFRHGWTQPAPRAPGRCPPLRAFLRALRPLQAASLALALLLFVVLPACLLWWPDPRLLLALLALVYGTGLACVAYLLRRRRVLGLHGRALALLVVDVLACPPFAVNVVRRVSLRRGTGMEARRFAGGVLPAAACAAVGEAIAARLSPADGAAA
ncbi:MAG: hypothetical protein ACTHKZ_05690 [Lysobacteraceae bacterium]